jgi:hypothetical protein
MWVILKRNCTMSRFMLGTWVNRELKRCNECGWGFHPKFIMDAYCLNPSDKMSHTGRGDLSDVDIDVQPTTLPASIKQ